jgi:pimeloyl-ACP methyl ester carboxylesterase
MSDPSVTFLLVHGSWHGSWCWERLVDALRLRGHRAITVDLPSVGDDPARLGGLPDDAGAVRDAAAGEPGEVIVVGHSYGGAVITEAAHPGNVTHLVYLGAFMPDTGRTFASYLPPGPLPAYVEQRADGTLAVPAGQARVAFYGHCDAGTAAWAEARLRVQSGAILGHPITDAAWRRIRSTYVVLGDDAAIPPGLQREFAVQATAAVELPSDHSPMLSQTAELAAVLADLAATTAPGR